jgi:CBS domain-containing protein
MQLVRHRLSSKMNLAEALNEMSNNHVEAMPVIESDESQKLVGVLDQRDARRVIGAKLMKRKATGS